MIRILRRVAITAAAAGLLTLGNAAGAHADVPVPVPAPSAPVGVSAPGACAGLVLVNIGICV